MFIVKTHREKYYDSALICNFTKIWFSFADQTSFGKKAAIRPESFKLFSIFIEFLSSYCKIHHFGFQFRYLPHTIFP